MELVIKAQRGLYLRGTIVDSQGVRADCAFVHADSELGCLVRRVDGGSWCIGPIEPIVHTLSATPCASSQLNSGVAAKSPRIECEAGALPGFK
ncbi:MAG: hypothetical protein ACI835_001281 [Planctomycetota bacterium]|jgi:hypothetical protein